MRQNKFTRIYNLFISGWFLLFRLLCFEKKLFAYHIPVVLTERCTLRCRHCDADIPKLPHPQDYDIEMLKKSLHNLLTITAWVDSFELFGGEPFLYPKLAELIEFLSKYKQIMSLRILSNGTVIPSPELLSIIKKHKVAVDISIYPCRQKKQQEFIDCLRKYRIPYRLYIYKETVYWKDYGDYHKRNFDPKTLAKSAKHCFLKHCRHVENGKFYFCKRVKNLDILSEYRSSPEDYVDLLDTENLYERIKKLWKKKYVVACDHCNISREKPKVSAAIQEED